MEAVDVRDKTRLDIVLSFSVVIEIEILITFQITSHFDLGY